MSALSQAFVGVASDFAPVERPQRSEFVCSAAEPQGPPARTVGKPTRTREETSIASHPLTVAFAPIRKLWGPMTCPEPKGAAWVEQLQSSHPRWDKEVCQRLVAGDEAALGELYDELSPLVYGLAARVTRDWAAAEDITQEVFVRVWENPQAFDPARGTCARRVR